MATTAERLDRIEAQLARIELTLALRVPPAEIRQAIEDAFDTLGQVVQLREVYFNQLTEITEQGVDLDILTESIERLLTQLRSHVVIWRSGDTERRAS
jgi:hypothetical protein